MKVLATPDVLLNLARALADGSLRLAGSDGARASSLVTRQALEQVISNLLDARGLVCPAASARSRLICLTQAYDDWPEVGFRASAAWWRLSSACHHHAYELNPTAAEAISLVNDVGWLHALSGKPEREPAIRPTPPARPAPVGTPKPSSPEQPDLFDEHSPRR